MKHDFPQQRPINSMWDIQSQDETEKIYEKSIITCIYYIEIMRKSGPGIVYLAVPGPAEGKSFSLQMVPPSGC